MQISNVEFPISKEFINFQFRNLRNRHYLEIGNSKFVISFSLPAFYPPLQPSAKASEALAEDGTASEGGVVKSKSLYDFLIMEVGQKQKQNFRTTAADYK